MDIMGIVCTWRTLVWHGTLVWRNYGLLTCGGGTDLHMFFLFFPYISFVMCIITRGGSEEYLDGWLFLCYRFFIFFRFL